MTQQTPILVCGNGGAAGREVLRRLDVTLHWALTIAEAKAVISAASPRVCLTREHLALPLLEAIAQKQRTPVVVLLDPDGHTRAQSYFAAGATALAPASSPERIVEALSELTGLAFARCPRVDFKTVVEVMMDGDEQLLETLNLSTSGTCIRGFPRRPLGVGVHVAFPMLDQPLEMDAMVARCFVQGGMECAGLAFTAMSPETRAQLEALIRAQIEKEPRPLGTVSVPTIARGSLSNAAKIGQDIHKSLKAHLRGKRTPVPDWLERAARELTGFEKEAALGEPSESWAKAALDLRLSLYRTRSVVTGNLPNELVERALGACRTLADKTADKGTATQVDATRYRAAILRELYTGDRSKDEPAEDSLDIPIFVDAA